VNREAFALASDVFQLILAAFLIWSVYRIIVRLFGISRPTEAEPPADYAGSTVRTKPRPRSGAGSVALAEPEDERSAPSGLVANPEVTFSTHPKEADDDRRT
jgi:hypothetical protein